MSMDFSLYIGPAVRVLGASYDWYNSLADELTDTFAQGQGEGYEGGDMWLLPNHKWVYSRDAWERHGDNEPEQIPFGQPRAEVLSFRHHFSLQLACLLETLTPEMSADVVWAIVPRWA